MQKVVQQKHVVQALHHIQMHAYCMSTNQDTGRETNPKINTTSWSPAAWGGLISSSRILLFSSFHFTSSASLPRSVTHQNQPGSWILVTCCTSQSYRTSWHCLRSKNKSYLSEPCPPLRTKGLRLILTSEQKLNFFFFLNSQSKKGKKFTFFLFVFHFQNHSQPDGQLLKLEVMKVDLSLLQHDGLSLSAVLQLRLPALWQSFLCDFNGDAQVSVLGISLILYMFTRVPLSNWLVETEQ